MTTRFTPVMIAVLCLLAASPSGMAGGAQRTQELVAVLKSDASFFEKARACQQLSEVGTSEAIPTLASLLGDEHLGAYARGGLEGIPDPAAADALRSALETTKGNQLRGVIGSLGVLRDAKAVPALSKLAVDPASGASQEALLSLGRISSPESIEVIQKILSGANESLRPGAAAAAILAAEQQMAAGKFDTALTLYDAVRGAKCTTSERIAAIRGAIIARQTKGPAFLVEQLESGDAAARLAALTTIREIPSDALAEAMNSELAKAAPELQRLLLLALVDCHNNASLEVLRAKTSSADAAVRETALGVTGRIGGAAEAQILLSVLAANNSPIETGLAKDSLQQLVAPGVDSLITRQLETAKDAAMRIQLIHVLAERGASVANPELLRQSASSDTRTAIAALGALSSLAGAPELPSLIALTKSATNQDVRAVGETAIIKTCERAGDSEAEAVLSEFKSASTIDNKTSWLRVLTVLGYAKALPAIRHLLTDTNATLASKAIDQLVEWPNPTPVEDLLAIVETDAPAGLRAHARVSAIQLIANAQEENQRPDPVLIAWLQRAARAAEPQDLRQVILILGHLKQVESFRALQPYLDNPAQRLDAARAVVQIAPALVKSEAAPALKQELQKITPALDPELSAQAAKIAASIP